MGKRHDSTSRSLSERAEAGHGCGSEAPERLAGAQAPAATPKRPYFVLLHPRDNVLVCTRPVAAGQGQEVDGRSLPALDAIEIGHKIARVDLRSGDPVIKLGATVGTMTADTARGAHVHLENMQSNYIPSHTRPAPSAGPSAPSRSNVQHGGPGASRGDRTEGSGDNL